MATPMTPASVPEWTVADRLRKARETADLKQTDLAELTGISRASIVNYEAGKTEPRRPALGAWALACGVSLHWLQTGEAPPDGGGDLGDRSSIWSNDLVSLSARRTSPGRILTFPTPAAA